MMKNESVEYIIMLIIGLVLGVFAGVLLCNSAWMYVSTKGYCREIGEYYYSVKQVNVLYLHDDGNFYAEPEKKESSND